MKIAWLVNFPLPEASVLLNQKPTPYGGWLVNASKYLAQEKDIELTVIFPIGKIDNLSKINGSYFNYIAFPKHINTKRMTEEFTEILATNYFDLIHIFGTEYAHTLAMVNVCSKLNIKFVVSIQGLLSVYANHFMANLPFNIRYRYTFRDFLKLNNLFSLQNEFRKKGKMEIEAINKSNNIIGRTSWDKACTNQINSDSNYYFCNEILRDSFYNFKWKHEDCEKYSIFVSQGSYPIKGLHYMLEALKIVLKDYPTTKLYISGMDITKSKSIKDRLKLTSYGKYILSLINRYNLENNVEFTGQLDEKEMIKKYLRSNVFVCPSSIENSPNSLGEAMILGVPCVSANVGGVSDMLIDKKEGFLYQADAPYMLAYYVSELFRNPDLATIFSKNAHDHAVNTHNREINTKKLKEIYNTIIRRG